jgi:co-chaperonin GroES (HSP10)
MEESQYTLDGYNVVELSHLGLSVEAIEDKIVVLVDQYRSGYECATCKGDKVVKVASTVVDGAFKEETCPECRGKGSILLIPEISKSLPTSGVVVSLGENTRWMKHLRHKENVRLYLIETRMESRNSMAAILQSDIEELLVIQEKNIKVRLGTRVIFSPHVGTFIPFKGNVKIKIMREHEPMAILYGAQAGTKDFLEYDSDFRM